MAHVEVSENLSPEEKEYRDCIRRGDDYSKIELLGYAKRYYERAKAMGIEDHTLEDKIAHVNVRLRNERRNIIIIFSVAAVIIAVWYFSTH